MDTTVNFSHAGASSTLAGGPRLAAIPQKLALSAWGLITLLGLLVFGLGVFSLNVWDRVPAADAELTRYFPSLTPQDIESHAAYQAVVLQAGFSLAGYALIFTVARLTGGLALFLVGFRLIWRYGDRLMAVLMACVLSVFGAAGLWGNPIWGWAVGLAPWLKYPAALLGWLLWCGVIVLYTFPDGRFVPRWTLGLAVLVALLGLFLAFDVNFFLNPGTWPDPLPLLPNIIFVGGGGLAVLYRYGRSTQPERKGPMHWYTLSLLLLMVLYFIDFSINEVYSTFAAQPLIQGYQAALTYVLAFEPLWYVLQTLFAVGLTMAVFASRPQGLLDP
jgi:hypothetical protein